jgi:hypothetical protein
MRLRLLLTIAVALAAAGLDLGLDQVRPGNVLDEHLRSTDWSLRAAVLLVIVLALPVLPSLLAASAAGIVAGGILGNLASARIGHGRIPNPLVLAGVAFNLGDVFVVAGVPLLMVSLARVAIHNREHIDRRIPPRRWELALRRKLGL